MAVGRYGTVSNLRGKLPVLPARCAALWALPICGLLTVAATGKFWAIGLGVSSHIPLATTVLVIATEFLLAWWLATGWLWKASYATTMALFVIFAITSAVRGLLGVTSCGCFGVFEVSPWLMVGIDGAAFSWLAVGLWLQAHLHGDGAVANARQCRQVGIGGRHHRPLSDAVVALAVVVTAGAVTGVIVGPGANWWYGHQLVIVRPETWMGRSLDDIPELAVLRPFRQGRWRVLFWRRGCDHCLAAQTVYLDSVAKWAAEGCQFVWVEVPHPRDENRQATDSDRESTVARFAPSIRQTQLDRRLTWVLSTPLEINLEEGVVTRVEDRPLASG